MGKFPQEFPRGWGRGGCRHKPGQGGRGVPPPGPFVCLSEARSPARPVGAGHGAAAGGAGGCGPDNGAAAGLCLTPLPPSRPGSGVKGFASRRGTAPGERHVGGAAGAGPLRREAPGGGEEGSGRVFGVFFRGDRAGLHVFLGEGGEKRPLPPGTPRFCLRPPVRGVGVGGLREEAAGFGGVQPLPGQRGARAASPGAEKWAFYR